MPLLYHNNNSISNVTSFPQITSGSLTLLSTATASGSASISFTSGIDSTYDIYYFEFINIHPATNGANFTFNMSTDGGSNYNVTKTTTYFMAIHTEADDFTVLEYRDDYSIAQGTGFKILARSLEGTDADGNLGGSLQLFNPSSTTYVKHFIARINSQETSGAGASEDNNISGYANTTSAINAIQFKMSSGNIDAGTIKMYGIKA